MENNQVNEDTKSTEEDGTRVYVYHRPVQLKRKDADGNREVRYRTITRRYKPKTYLAQCRSRMYEIIKELLESHSNTKSGELYKQYVAKCNEEHISEDYQFTLNSFYNIAKKIKNEATAA